MIPYTLLLIFFLWAIYDGDVYPREGGILGGIFVALQLAIFLLKLPVPWYIVSATLLAIYLVVKVFGGDVKIR